MNNPEEIYSNATAHLSETQLLRYEEGQMNSAEMHRAELHLLHCDLCSEALEGFAMLEPVEVKNAIKDLKGRLSERVGANKNDEKTGYWKWSIAASVLFLFSLSVYFVLNQATKKDTEVTQLERKEVVPAASPIPPATFGDRYGFSGKGNCHELRSGAASRDGS